MCRIFALYQFLLILLSGYGVVDTISGQIAYEELSGQYNVRHSMGDIALGGGVTIFDFDQDGWEDLTLATAKGFKLGFYRNTGSGYIKLDPLVDNTESVKQINWVDYDNDGDPDLYVVGNEGVSRLYMNEGNLELRDVTEESGLPLNFHYGYGACWGDYNRDGWLDLYYASKGIIGDPEAIRSYNRLFRNNGDGTFTERTEESNTADDGKLPFCAAFIDYNNDGWPDIYIANDKLTFNTLLENTGNGWFDDVSVRTGANARMNAMCVNPGDYNRDGWIDIFISNTPVGSQCLRNNGFSDEGQGISFNNVAVEIGVDFAGTNCWGANFYDADNDGDMDLYVSSSIPSPKEVSSALFENIDGLYFDAPYITGMQKDTSNSFSNAIGDLNNDGLLDIVVNNNPPDDFFIWENQTSVSNHWLKVELEGVLSNRDGIGVRIDSYSGGQYQMIYTQIGTGYLAQNSSIYHFGLGEIEVVDSLVLTWPTGHIDKLYNIQSDQKIFVLEGSTTNGDINVDEDVVIMPRNITTSTDVINATQITIFPNPSTSYLELRSKEDIRKIEIYSIDGIVVKNITTMSPNMEIDTSLLNSGLYFMRVYDDAGGVHIFRFIKR